MPRGIKIDSLSDTLYKHDCTGFHSRGMGRGIFLPLRYISVTVLAKKCTAYRKQNVMQREHAPRYESIHPVLSFCNTYIIRCDLTQSKALHFLGNHAPRLHPHNRCLCAINHLPAELFSHEFQSLLPCPIQVLISATSSYPLTSILAPLFHIGNPTQPHPKLSSNSSPFANNSRNVLRIPLMVFDSLEVLVELQDDTYIRT